MSSDRDDYARIMVRASTRASVKDAWTLITDWPAQSRWIAFTTVFIVREANGVGTRFTGRTQVGPIHFDDPMEVTTWEPPDDGDRGYCRVEKFGPWILGSAEIEVQRDDNWTAVIWRESIRARGVPAVFNPIVRAMGGVLFRMTVRKAIAELDARSLGS